MSLGKEKKVFRNKYGENLQNKPNREEIDLIVCWFFFYNLTYIHAGEFTLMISYPFNDLRRPLHVSSKAGSQLELSEFIWFFFYNLTCMNLLNRFFTIGFILMVSFPYHHPMETLK